MSDIFADRKLDVQRALSLFASSYATFPASAIDDEAQTASLLPIVQKSHVYLIGSRPSVELVGARSAGDMLVTDVQVEGSRYSLEWRPPPGASVAHDQLYGWHIRTAAGEKTLPSQSVMAHRLCHEKHVIGFDVLYIGQAFGADGERQPLDRMLPRETLQQIALTGAPKGQGLSVLMLEIQMNDKVGIALNPLAVDVSEAERATLYEASLIRYFQPKFNRQFEAGFPSTNLKILADCAGKNLSAVVAEICIDELPFYLKSDAVAAQRDHFARHGLNTEENRKAFFGL